MLYNNDCLYTLKEIQDESIDMIYLDPPFFTQKNQKLSDSNGKKYEFSDIWESRHEYVCYMRERLIEMQRVLKSSGNIFLHCDTSASYYLRALLDDVFGENNFQSEIIWTYKRWSNSRKGLLPNHQSILFYSKTKRHKFNTIFGEYSPTTNIDQILQERERTPKGKATYKRTSNGDIVTAKEKKGVPLPDVWEIPFLNPKAKERTGYPTQKPIELLERIIMISTDEDDTVLDPFCGSGTTLVSAKLLNRNYIGIDISKDAIELSSQRLNAPFKTTSTLLKVGADAYKTKSNKELALLERLDCDIVQRNKGIDAFLKRHYLGKPVAIKIQRKDENLADTILLLDSAGKKKQCSFTVLISSEPEEIIMTSLVPRNMIILREYQVELEERLCNLIEQEQF